MAVLRTEPTKRFVAAQGMQSTGIWSSFRDFYGIVHECFCGLDAALVSNRRMDFITRLSRLGVSRNGPTSQGEVL